MTEPEQLPRAKQTRPHWPRSSVLLPRQYIRNSISDLDDRSLLFRVLLCPRYCCERILSSFSLGGPQLAYYCS